MIDTNNKMGVHSSCLRPNRSRRSDPPGQTRQTPSMSAEDQTGPRQAASRTSSDERPISLAAADVPVGRASSFRREPSSRSGSSDPPGLCAVATSSVQSRSSGQTSFSVRTRPSGRAESFVERGFPRQTSSLVPRESSKQVSRLSRASSVNRMTLLESQNSGRSAVSVESGSTPRPVRFSDAKPYQSESLWNQARASLRRKNSKHVSSDPNLSVFLTSYACLLLQERLSSAKELSASSFGRHSGGLGEQ